MREEMDEEIQNCSNVCVHTSFSLANGEYQRRALGGLTRPLVELLSKYTRAEAEIIYFPNLSDLCRNSLT